MAISIETVEPEDLIDQGRTKFDNNDTAIANGLTALQSQLDTHNHDDIYYTKSEIDAKTFQINAFAIQVQIHPGSSPNAQVAGVDVNSDPGVPMPVACSLVNVLLVGTNGERAPYYFSKGSYNWTENDVLFVSATSSGPTVSGYSGTVNLTIKNGSSQGPTLNIPSNAPTQVGIVTLEFS